MSADEAEATLFENLMSLYRQLLVLLDDVDCPYEASAFSNFIRRLTVNPSTNQTDLWVPHNEFHAVAQCESQPKVSSPQDPVHMPINYGPRFQQNNPIGTIPPCYHNRQFYYQPASWYMALGQQQQTNVFNSLQHQRRCPLNMQVHGQAALRPMTPCYMYLVVSYANQHGCAYRFGHPPDQRLQPARIPGNWNSYTYPIYATYGDPKVKTCPGSAVHGLSHSAGQPLNSQQGSLFVDPSVPPVHATAVQPTTEAWPGSAGSAVGGCSRLAGQPLGFHGWCRYVDSGVPPVHASAVQPTKQACPGSPVDGLSRFVEHQLNHGSEKVPPPEKGLAPINTYPQGHDEDHFIAEMSQFPNQQLGLVPDKETPPENVANVVTTCVKHVYTSLHPEEQSSDTCAEQGATAPPATAPPATAPPATAPPAIAPPATAPPAIAPPENAATISCSSSSVDPVPTNQFATDEAGLIEQPHDLMHALQQPSNPTAPVEADNAADGPPEFADDVEIEESSIDIIGRCLNILENLKYIASWDSPD